MQRVQQKKLSDVITEHLESMTIDGRLLTGQQLPPQRELAGKFAVSRPALCDDSQNLKAKGLLYRKQGGGIFVRRNLTVIVTSPLIDSIAKSPETQFDLSEFRHALGEIAA